MSEMFAALDVARSGMGVYKTWIDALADENGMVRRPDIDLGDQMVLVQLAQRGYQANINTFERAREAYEAALSIGK